MVCYCFATMEAVRQLGFGEQPPTYLASDRPSRVGPVTQISYADAGSLLTPGSGFMRAYKFLINPYSGCGFGCDYCYARFFAPTPELRDSWGEWLTVKQNAKAIVERATRARTSAHRIEPGDALYMSSVTDPYQPIEQRLGLTREILEALVPLQPRLTIQTRSPIVVRDIDLLRQFERVRVNLTVTTDSERVRLRYEPHCPAIEVRLETAEKLSRAGVPIGISVSPLFPMDDVEKFGHRIAALNAVEYVTQYFKDPRQRFSAGTSVEALEKTREDGWGREQYARAREVLTRILGPERPLLEGMEGYAPPP